MQGFSTGGEYGGAATFIAEYAPDARRGFYGSFLEFGTLAGYVLGAGVATAFQLGLPPEAMNSWGWRLLMPETARISIAHPTAIPGRTPAPAAA